MITRPLFLKYLQCLRMDLQWEEQLICKYKKKILIWCYIQIPDIRRISICTLTTAWAIQLINLYWSTDIYSYALFTVTAKGWSSDSQLNVILGNVNEDWKAKICHQKWHGISSGGMGMILNWNSTTLGPTKLHILLTRQRQSLNHLHLLPFS